jgi:hypothetical protein
MAKKPKRKSNVGKKKAAARGKKSKVLKTKRTRRRVRGPQLVETPLPRSEEEVGAGSAGQAGDTEGLSREEDVDSESVEELTEEGQDYEAEVVDGVEEAPDPDAGRHARLRTRHYIPPEEQ